LRSKFNLNFKIKKLKKYVRASHMRCIYKPGSTKKFLKYLENIKKGNNWKYLSKLSLL